MMPRQVCGRDCHVAGHLTVISVAIRPLGHVLQFFRDHDKGHLVEARHKLILR